MTSGDDSGNDFQAHFLTRKDERISLFKVSREDARQCQRMEQRFSFFLQNHQNCIYFPGEFYYLVIAEAKESKEYLQAPGIGAEQKFIS